MALERGVRGKGDETAARRGADQLSLWLEPRRARESGPRSLVATVARPWVATLSTLWRAWLRLRQLQLAAAQVEAFAAGLLVASVLGGEDVGVQAIDHEPPLLLGLDDLLPLENLQVVRDVGDFRRKSGGNLADILGPAAKHLHDSQAVGVGQGLQPLGAFLGR